MTGEDRAEQTAAVAESDPIRRARLKEWARIEMGMPWERDVLDAAARELGVLPLELRDELLAK